MTAVGPAERRRRRMAALSRRRDFLADRIKSHKGKDSSWDKAECSALTWALQVVRAAEAEGVIAELEQVVIPGQTSGA